MLEKKLFLLSFFLVLQLCTKNCVLFLRYQVVCAYGAIYIYLRALSNESIEQNSYLNCIFIGTYVPKEFARMDFLKKNSPYFLAR